MQRTAGSGGADVADRAAVVSLDDPAALDPRLVGAKAASLAAARRAGLPVLPGIVLTTAVDPADLPLATVAAWAEITAAPGTSAVVRSSSTIEDGRQQSMAGMFTSVVDVRSLEAFRDAVDQVLASAKVVPLAGTRAPLAVLVQPFVPSRLGGVLFGVDPVSGRRDRMVVATSDGGPVALVQGEADGQSATLTRHGHLVTGSSPLTSSELHRLAHLARRTASLFGSPQDVEWAIGAEGRLWLLQSRPVTAVAGPARGPVLGPGPVAETFPEPLAPLELDLWVEPLRTAIRRALELAGATSRAAIRRSPVVTSVGGRVAVDLELFGASRAPRRGWARLDPRPPARRLVAAWRVGRLRAALPALARDVLERADADLAEVGPAKELPSAGLLAVLEGSQARLVSLHGYEVLMGWLVSESVSTTTAASVALRLLAEGRAEGLTDGELLARFPTVLALLPPRIGAEPVLPPAPPVPPALVPGAVDDAGDDDVAILREALRLRARWVQELSARAAEELGRRLAARTTISSPLLVRWMRLDELRRAVTRGEVPADLDTRPAAHQSPPLPARFRLSEDGSVVAEAAGAAGPTGAVGAGGGRGGGVVHSGVGTPPEGAVLVVRTLDPSLAPWLPRLAGLVAETGNPLSHLAILAREFHVPTVVGVVDALVRFPPGTSVVVDGSTGEVSELGSAEAGVA